MSSRGLSSNDSEHRALFVSRATLRHCCVYVCMTLYVRRLPIAGESVLQLAVDVEPDKKELTPCDVTASACGRVTCWPTTSDVVTRDTNAFEFHDTYAYAQSFKYINCTVILQRWCVARTKHRWLFKVFLISKVADLQNTTGNAPNNFVNFLPSRSLYGRSLASANLQMLLKIHKAMVTDILLLWRCCSKDTFHAKPSLSQKFKAFLPLPIMEAEIIFASFQ